jgi:sec-independent protein translocase protein TatA
MGPWQIVLIALAILLLWGGKKIPELMKGLGGGIKEFKKASRKTMIRKKKLKKNKSIPGNRRDFLLYRNRAHHCF